MSGCRAYLKLSPTRAAELHFGLLKSAEWANGFFSAQLLALVVRVTLNTTLFMFLIQGSLKMGASRGILAASYGLTSEMLFLGLMTRSCDSLMELSEQIKEAIFLKIRQDPMLYVNEGKLALYVHTSPKSVFSANGYFKIGYPLVTSIITSCVSFFVILLQFSKAEKKNVEKV